MDIRSKRRRKVCVQVATSCYESVFFYCDKFFHRIESDCIWKSGDADSIGETDSRMSIEPNSFNAASTSQVRFEDSYFGGLMEKQWWNPSNSRRRRFRILRQSWGCCIIEGNLLPRTVKLGWQPLAHGASSSVDKESQKDTEAMWNHYFQISPNTSHYMEAVFSMVRKIYGRQFDDPMKLLDVNLATWWMFTNTTLRAEVHLGKDSDIN